MGEVGGCSAGVWYSQEALEHGLDVFGGRIPSETCYAKSIRATI